MVGANPLCSVLAGYTINLPGFGVISLYPNVLLNLVALPQCFFQTGFT